MTAYRKIRAADTWHWCENCSSWPDRDFIERKGPPGIGQLCGECKALDKSNICEETEVQRS